MKRLMSLVKDYQSEIIFCATLIMIACAEKTALITATAFFAFAYISFRASFDAGKIMKVTKIDSIYLSAYPNPKEFLGLPLLSMIGAIVSIFIFFMNINTEHPGSLLIFFSLVYLLCIGIAYLIGESFAVVAQKI